METITTPRPVRWALALLGLVAVSHLVVPVVIWADQGDLRSQIAAQHPEFGPAEIARSADVAVVSAAVFHILLLALCALLLWRLPTGRPWTRRLAIISQLLSVVFSAVSWSSSPMFHAVIPVIGVAQILLVILLLAPQSARAFFAKRP
ncbi:hypothetical protein [Kutzneria sp. NPDC052558]|uniref:hypothetical protein n=1 Tax=Kutzneria sp. NPDC052558 TaxID=3364121 RepID=UPI0037CAF787